MGELTKRRPESRAGKRSKEERGEGGKIKKGEEREKKNPGVGDLGITNIGA